MLPMIMIMILIMSVKGTVMGIEVLMALNQSGHPGPNRIALKPGWVSAWKPYTEVFGLLPGWIPEPSGCILLHSKAGNPFLLTLLASHLASSSPHLDLPP